VQPLWQKSSISFFHFPIFAKQVARNFRGIFIIPFLLLANFFSFHICDQRKEAKERRFVNDSF
jgi:preprotein translocase subunit YajC